MKAKNLLLTALPKDVRDRVARSSETVALSQGQIVHHPGERIENVYFPLDCLISVTVTTADVRTAEAGIVGSREMVGLNAFMGGSETNQTEYICQSPGSAVKVPAALLLDEFDGNECVNS